MSLLTKFGKVKTLQNALIAYGRQNRIAWIDNQNYNRNNGGKPLPPNKRGKTWFKDVTGPNVPPSITNARKLIAKYKQEYENINATITSVKHPSIKKVRFAATTTPTLKKPRTRKRFSPFSTPFYVRRWQRRYRSLSSYTKSYTRRYSPSYTARYRSSYPRYNRRFFPFRRYQTYRSNYRPYLRGYARRSYSSRTYSPRTYKPTRTSTTSTGRKLIFDPKLPQNSNDMKLYLQSFQSDSTPIASNTRSKAKTRSTSLRANSQSIASKRKHGELASLLDDINAIENEKIKKPKRQSKASKKVVEVAEDRFDSTARDDIDNLHLPLDDISDTQTTINDNGVSNDFSDDTTVPNPFGPTKRTRSSTLVDLSFTDDIDETDLDPTPPKHVLLKSLKQFLKKMPNSKVGKLFMQRLQSNTYDPLDPITRKIARQWAQQQATSKRKR